MLIVRLMGGLGNQMFQYALGRRLAIERRVLLKLDVSWYQNRNSRTYSLAAFHMQAEIASPQEVDLIRGSNVSRGPTRLFHAIQRRLPYPWRTVIQEKTLEFDPRVLRAPKTAYLVGYWQSEEYFKPIRSILLKECQLREALGVERIALADEIRTGESVSVHVRRRDYVSHPVFRQVFEVCSLEYYQQAVEYVNERITCPRFYIFSDDPVWAKENLCGIAEPITFIHPSNKDRDYEDLYLMSLCKHHVIANSSFSWWGAWLCTSSPKLVVAPEKWLKNEARNSNSRLPDDWIRL